MRARALSAVAPDSPWWFLCAGSVTSWGSKLVGEEFPPDARIPWYEIFTQPNENNREAALGEVRAFGYYASSPEKGLVTGTALPSPFPSNGDISTNATLMLEAAVSIKPYNSARWYIWPAFTFGP